MIELILFILLAILCYSLFQFNHILTEINKTLKGIKITNTNQEKSSYTTKPLTNNLDDLESIKVDLSDFNEKKSKTEVKLNLDNKSESVSDDTKKALDMLKKHKKNSED